VPAARPAPAPHSAKEATLLGDIDHQLHVGREDGQALVEYALIIAFVAIVCAGTLGVLGTTVDAAIQSAVSAL
jgi:Flp pilus assembly pilin Flp